MEIEEKQLEPVQSKAPGGMLPATGGETDTLSQLPPSDTGEAEWRQVANKTTDFLAELPEYLTSFFQGNQRSLTNLALILSAIITFKVVIAILGAINDIPLLEPFFELIGIGYFAWFSWRYLIKTELRQELNHKIRLFKQEIWGE
ncbi:CAAD domain-containing protein [Nodularia harveyana UHCC-0300]|uniref:CAAD domain-containing protein n=1 Tax=Nodularia harveyana UHCC-0300 TaxID=2974287 RepID=A0ABU5UC95_9CYAN|nr:CAAD domain-containing protein [Nodularia harveyana]MEA5581144.1 CAAD domain-containing protein [Nodularia harveyana UHCC-0300]